MNNSADNNIHRDAHRFQLPQGRKCWPGLKKQSWSILNAATVLCLCGLLALSSLGFSFSGTSNESSDAGRESAQRVCRVFASPATDRCSSQSLLPLASGHYAISELLLSLDA